MRLSVCWRIALTVICLFALRANGSALTCSAEAPADSLYVVVMDPLAKPLSCPCVAGYAQRDYDKLGAAISEALGREVKVIFNESLVAALNKGGAERADLVIGKQSVILHDAKQAGVTLDKVAMLTGKDGLTTQRGLLVVPALDPALKISDLKDYRIIFGPSECDEKNAAALSLLDQHGVEKPDTLETAVACDEGAVKILELAEQGVRGCAVISSYAKPLLEGCGQVPKGAIRVLAETAEVPFVAAYVNESLDDEQKAALRKALLQSTAKDVTLRIALETKRGFVTEDASATADAKKK
jgi:ABC-type phosphate/phosphonate transport system substrate-binding protein